MAVWELHLSPIELVGRAASVYFLFLVALRVFGKRELGQVTGKWIPEALEREGLDEEDLGAALREHGLESAEEMKLAVLEQDGTISIVAREGAVRMRARRRHYRRMK